MRCGAAPGRRHLPAATGLGGGSATRERASQPRPAPYVNGHPAPPMESGAGGGAACPPLKVTCCQGPSFALDVERGGTGRTRSGAPAPQQDCFGLFSYFLFFIPRQIFIHLYLSIFVDFLFACFFLALRAPAEGCAVPRRSARAHPRRRGGSAPRPLFASPARAHQCST